MRRRRQSVLMLVGIAGVVGIGLAVPLYGLYCWWMQDNPEMVYRRHQHELNLYVEQLAAGTAPKRPNGGYAVPPFLVDHGVRRVVLADDCVEIVFSFMPTNEVPMLWYSPRGFDPLPPRLEELKRTCHYFRWQELSANWGACYWDQ